MHGDKPTARGRERSNERDNTPATKDASRLRVLLVDDEAPVRESLAMLLAMDGHAVQECDSGVAALQVLASEKFDLVITDNRMPGMKGDELARRLHDEFPGIPVVMLTGFNDLPIGPDNPVKAIFHKPEQIRDLRQAIPKLCSRNRN